MMTLFKLAWTVYLVVISLCHVSSIVKFNSNSIKLGIDYGPRLIGLAISDRFAKAHPLMAITNTLNLTEISLDIASIVQNKGVSDIVLGIPLDSNGKLHYGVKNFNGGLCLQFSQVLACIVNNKIPNVNVYLIDERYSTREAKARMKSEKITASIDAMSAACLIERFHEDEGEYSILAQPCVYPPPVELEILDYNQVSDYVRESREQEMNPLDFHKKRIQSLKVTFYFY